MVRRNAVVGLRASCRCGVFGLVVVVCLVGAGAAAAATLHVTSSGDSGPGTLRGVVGAAGAGDTVVIDTGVNPSLTSGEVVVDKSLMITGAGARSTVVNANDASRVFRITGGTVMISSLRITGGNGRGSGSVGSEGGGVYQEGGSLSLDRVSVDNNAINEYEGGAVGGGIASAGSSLAISNSTVASNSAYVYHGGGIGGGIYVAPGTSLTSINSTIANNTVDGGDSATGGGIYDDGAATLVHATLAGNTATAGGASYPAGDVFSSGTVSFQNTIIANGAASSGASCSGSGFSSKGNNLEDTSPSQCSLNGAHGDLIGANPMFAGRTPANNGGQTDTLALQPTSPAVDHVPTASCVANADQRAMPRPDRSETTCDIGAYEQQDAADTSPPQITIAPPSDGAHYPLHSTVTASYACSDPDGPGDVSSCTAPVPNGQPIDTATVGPHTFTVNASDAAGNTTTRSVTYTVSPLAPDVVTGAASSVSVSGATSHGTVNPNGATVTDCHFDWGPTSAYGHTTPCASSPGSGTSPVPVSATLTSLTANTTYHYRLDATNTAGTTKGTRASLRTRQRPVAKPPCPRQGCLIPMPPRCRNPLHRCPAPAPSPNLTPRPQLCGPLATLPWSHGVACTIREVASGNHTTITISNPVVDRAAYEYSGVRFSPGDEITFSAGGCVQTGGHGKTWKRYVDPSGANSGADWPGLYHGTVSIPAARLRGQAVIDRSIHEIINGSRSTPIEVAAPSAAAPPSVLTLGYRDDDGPRGNDNGYYAHEGDEGNHHQCPLHHGDGGNAWVVIDIVHGAPSPAQAPAVKAFDLVTSTFDQNGAAVDPVWGWQLPGTPELGRDFNNVVGHYEEDCGALRTISAHPHGPPGKILPPARDTASGASRTILVPPRPQDPAPASCTNQITNLNPAPEPWYNSVWNFFGGGGECQNAAQQPAGHLNWGEVRYTGELTYRPGRPKYREVLEYSGGWPQDNDYNLSLRSATAPLGPKYFAGVTPPDEGSIGLEFLTNETIDQFAGDRTLPWWYAVHVAADKTFSVPPIAATANQWLVDHLYQHRVVALGPMGLDLVHGSPASEVHPVHGLAIEENSPDAGARVGDVPPADPGNDRWAFFVRNWGNEGDCSTAQVNLDARTVTLRIPPPVGAPSATLLAVLPSTPLAGGASAASVGPSTDGGAQITVTLPPPDQHGWVAGEVTLRWAGAGLGGATWPSIHPLPPYPQPACGRREGVARAEEAGPEKRALQIYDALTDAQRKLYCELVPPWSADKPGYRAHPIPLQAVTQPATYQQVQPHLSMAYDPTFLRNIVARENALGIAGAQKGQLGPGTPCRVAESLIRPPTLLTAPGEPTYWRAPKPIVVQARLPRAAMRAVRQGLRVCGLK